jgi:hypothetical protein
MQTTKAQIYNTSKHTRSFLHIVKKKQRKYWNVLKKHKSCILNKEHNAKHSKPHSQIDRCEKNGVHQMKCMDCQLKCVGQTGQMFYIGYEEDIQAIRNNNGKMVTQDILITY